MPPTTNRRIRSINSVDDKSQSVAERRESIVDDKSRSVAERRESIVDDKSRSLVEQRESIVEDDNDSLMSGGGSEDDDEEEDENDDDEENIENGNITRSSHVFKGEFIMPPYEHAKRQLSQLYGMFHLG